MKEVYAPPTVTKHGTIQQITQGGVQARSPDGMTGRRGGRGGGAST